MLKIGYSEVEDILYELDRLSQRDVEADWNAFVELILEEPVHLLRKKYSYPQKWHYQPKWNMLQEAAAELISVLREMTPQTWNCDKVEIGLLRFLYHRDGPATAGSREGRSSAGHIRAAQRKEITAKKVDKIQADWRKMRATIPERDIASKLAPRHHMKAHSIRRYRPPLKKVTSS
jgi:hypothetical protein